MAQAESGPASPQKKSPALSAGLSLLSLGLNSELTSALALLTGVWLTGFLALTIRLLPLLSGLLAATLLLAGLLTRGLVLLTLTRILFLAGHSGISLC
jgi:hypothetical protein